MLEFSRWKYIVVLVVLLGSVVYALPNLYPSDPAVQISANKGAKVDAALTSRVQALLVEHKLAAKSVAIEDDNLLVRMPDSDSQTKANDLIRPNLGKDFGENYTVALNLAPTVPAWLGAIGARPMSLGLDLQGGVHFLLEVDQAAAREKRENAYVEEIRGLLRDKNIRYGEVSRSAQGLRIQLANAADRDKALNQLTVSLPSISFNGGVGEMITAQVSPAEIKKISDDAIEQNITTLRNRINSLGVAEPIIQRQGSNRIIVQLPGLQDSTKAKELLGGTATLEFRAVVEGNAEQALRDSNIPANARYYGETTLGQPILLSKRLLVSGDQLVEAIPGTDPQDGSPNVSIKLDNAGGKRMFDFTLENVGKRLGIVYIERIPSTTIVDGKEVRSSRTVERVISASTVRGVFGKDFQTSGLSRDEAASLAQQLKAGALAAPVDIVEERVVGPSLGAENIERGVQAVMFSFVFVLVFFLIYYKMFGVITNLALLVNLLMVIAVMSLLGATLTLPGFAGIALTVGMSVDANVLINERIREELRMGNTPLASIAAGYDKASGTIADANVTALLGGIAMAAFGSGPIRGFGITLIIGIVTSMYTAVSVSRGIATLIYGRRRKLAKVSI